MLFFWNHLLGRSSFSWIFSLAWVPCPGKLQPWRTQQTRSIHIVKNQSRWSDTWEGLWSSQVGEHRLRRKTTSKNHHTPWWQMWGNFSKFICENTKTSHVRERNHSIKNFWPRAVVKQKRICHSTFMKNSQEKWLNKWIAFGKNGLTSGKKWFLDSLDHRASTQSGKKCVFLHF